MLRSRKTFLIAAGLAVFAVAGTVLVYSGYLRSGVAGASPATELLSEIPSGAPTLIYLDLAAIRASSFYQNRPDHSPLTIPDSDYAKFVQATGFDFEKDLDRVDSEEHPSVRAERDHRFSLDSHDGKVPARKPSPEPPGSVSVVSGTTRYLP